MKRSNTFTMWCMILCCFTCDADNIDENKNEKNDSENKL